MDNNARMYMPPEYEKILAEQFQQKVDALAAEIEFRDPPADALPIEDKEIAVELAGMNRAARLAFYSERRRGGSEVAGIEAARRTVK